MFYFNRKRNGKIYLSLDKKKPAFAGFFLKLVEHNMSEVSVTKALN